MEPIPPEFNHKAIKVIGISVRSFPEEHLFHFVVNSFILYYSLPLSCQQPASFQADKFNSAFYGFLLFSAINKEILDSFLFFPSLYPGGKLMFLSEGAI